MKEYKSMYVRAKKEKDGVYEITKTCGIMIVIYNTKEQAEKSKDMDEIIIDIGTVADRNLMFEKKGELHPGWLDISNRVK